MSEEEKQDAIQDGPIDTVLEVQDLNITIAEFMDMIFKNKNVEVINNG